MEIYGDVYFLLNLAADFFLLWMTALWAREEPKPMRILLAALVGAAYALALLFLPAFFWMLPARLVIGLPMAGLAFGFRDLGRVLRLAGVYYGINFLAGGASYALTIAGPASGWLPGGVFWLKDRGLIPVVMMACATGGKLLFDAIARRARISRLLIPTEVVFGGQRVALKGFVDTGNNLRDPVTAGPVMVVEYPAIKSLLPPKILEAIKGNGELDPFLLTGVLGDGPWSTRFRLIPFSSLGRESGLLLGFRPDEVRLWRGSFAHTSRRAIVGVYPRTLSRDGSYNALLSPEFLNTA